MDNLSTVVARLADKITTSVSNTSKCQKCNDTGFIYTDNGAIECECALRARDQRRIEKLFKSAKIPARYRGKTLDNFDISWQPKAHKIAVEYAKTWPKERGESLFFVGPVGTGKSHLARAILSTMIRRHGISGLAATVPNLMDDLRPGADDGKSNEQIQLLKTVPLLVLDDLGAQKTTDWVTERLFVIINARYDELLPTVITSNIYLEELRKIPGWDRLVDRIVEMARAVRMEGKSYRMWGKFTGKEVQ